MSLNIPIGVRLKTVLADRRVTKEVLGVNLKTVAPGGFSSAEVRLSRPIQLQPVELASFGRIYFYDTTNGNTVWEGRVEDLGRTADASGQIWDINAVGPSAHVHDLTRALYYVDQRMDAITVGPGSYAGTQVTSDVVPVTGNAAVKQQFPAGATVTSSANTKSIAFYPDIRSAFDLKLARVTWSIYSGYTSATDWAIRVWVSPGVGVFNQVFSASPVTGEMGSNTVRVGSDFSSGENQVTFEQQWIKVASGTIGNDNTWVDFHDITIQQVRVDTSGNEILFAGGYPNDTVDAASIVNDLLGRMLPMFDGPNAFVDTSNAFGIEQLVYPDGADAGQVLDDLMALLGTHTWSAWETNPVSGRWTFSFYPWDTEVRYEATVKDGYTSPISASDVYDEVLVRWKQSDGRVRTNLYLDDIQILIDAGIHKTGFIDLSDAIGSQNDADQAGAQFLANHALPANSGTLTIARPIFDRFTGRTVYPWDVRAGYLIRIRGVEPQADLLNVARNGASVCRIISTEYSDSNNSVQCDLDTYPIEQSQQIATLSKNLTNRRRR